MFSFSEKSLLFGQAEEIDLIDYQYFYFRSQELLNKLATNKRITDFTLGRIAADRAINLSNEINDRIFIEKADDKLPLWPSGYVGSIAHSNNYAVCLASYSSYRSIGVDLELIRSDINPNLIKKICTVEEQDWLNSVSDLRQELIKVFSAKEAIYKALYSLFKTEMFFKDVSIIKDSEDSFITSAIKKVTFNSSINVKQKMANNFLLSYVLI